MHARRLRGQMRRRWAGALLAWGILLACVLASAPTAWARPLGGSRERPLHVQPAVDGVFELFKDKSVVALGDAHGLAQEESFYGALVEDPRFAKLVGNVVVEFGGAVAQGIIDRYVAGENVPFSALRRVWTDTAGAFSPGEPAPLGLVDFFASVRAANMKLPPGRRIKVWLGDPKVDWSKIHSFQDLVPILRQRDAHLFQVLDRNILKEHKKALLIVGLAHLFSPVSMNMVGTRLNRRYPGAMAVVAPFLGYIEPECNRNVVARAKGWPTPALAWPVAGTTLQSWLQLPGCSYVPAAQVQRMQAMAKMMAKMHGRPGGRVMTLGGGTPPSPTEMLSSEFDVLSGRRADAILYLGPPATLTDSPIEPSSYMNQKYFEEADHRARCCSPSGAPLNWDQLLEQGSVLPRRFQVPR